MSTSPRFTLLEPRGVLSISGTDRVGFLQGLVSNDVEKVGPEVAVYAALLTPQGKYLHDFFIAELDGAVQLDCERARIDDLKKRLAMYKLRSAVALDDRSDDLSVAALFGDGALDALGLEAGPGAAMPFAGGVAFVDPRLADAGARAIVPRDGAEAALEAAGFAAAGADDYDRHRLGLGLPDGSRDMVTEKSILLESGFDELNGVDWQKGCYMGQELTARTKYRGLIKKRLVPVALSGPAPAPGTPIRLGDKEAGEMRSAQATDGGAIGLALMRLDSLEAASGGGEMSADGVPLKAKKPDWAQF